MYDFLVLFALIGAIGLIVSWRSGSFIARAVQAPVAPRRPMPPRAPMKSAEPKPHEPKPREPEPRVAQRDKSLALLPAPEPTPVAKEVLAAARARAVAHGRKVLPDHWSTIAIGQRPGWMIFEPSDFLGTSGVEMTYEIPGRSQSGVLELHPIELVRAVEHSSNVVAVSRRKVVQSRWDARAKRRASASARAVETLKRAV